MAKNKKQRTTEETYTQVTPVVSCSDETQVDRLMHLCGTARAVTYNKLGSIQGWGKNWKFAAPIIRAILPPEAQGMDKCRKIWEWSVNDTIKAINAQQEAAKVVLIREIWRKCPMQFSQKQRASWLDKNGKSRLDEAFALFPKCEIELERERLLNLLNTNPTENKWLHRQFRKQYQRGHTFVRNQIVYQGVGYQCKRINRHCVKLQVQGLQRRSKITLRLRCRQIIKGQIRLIRNEQGTLEVHHTRSRVLILPDGKPTKKLGIDKGYTEAFYTSEGQTIADGLGKLMTDKTKRITSTNRNRYRLRSYAQNCNNSVKSAKILEHNLGYKVKSRKLQREKAMIQNFIRKDLRKTITSPMEIFVEDLTQPITGKHHFKAINRKLNQWMKGELQASIDKIALETGSKVSLVNCAYTSQMCSQTGTLLGSRNGDHFTCYTGVVLQADLNAALNIRNRGTDSEITPLMHRSEVETVLLDRTVRYLWTLGLSVTDALDLGWLNSKFKAKALRLESKYHLQG